MANLKDSHKFTDYFWQSYDYGNTPKEIMETVCEELAQDNGLADNKEEIKDILFDCWNMTNEELCKEYDINKIGDMYFRGNW